MPAPHSDTLSLAPQGWLLLPQCACASSCARHDGAMSGGAWVLVHVAVAINAAAVSASLVSPPLPPLPVYPGKSWARVAPSSVGLNATKLDAFRAFLGPESHGVVVRYGKLAYSWGKYTERHVAAAMARTWMPRCDGAIILSDVTDEDIPSVKVRSLLVRRKRGSPPRVSGCVGV